MNAPLPPGAAPGTQPYQPGVPAPQDHRPPPPPAGDGGALAVAALLLSLVGCLGFPVIYLLVPAFVDGDPIEAMVVAMVIGAVVVVASIVVSIWALVVARRGQSGRKVMAVIAVIIACFSPVTAVVAGFFGILLKAGGGVHGRPLRRRDGSPSVATDAGGDAWIDDALAPRVDHLTDAEREALAAAWLADARLEHASIAAFGRVALDLIAAAAPPDLVLRAHQAALEEIAHARAAFSIASAYAGAPRGPGAFPEASAVWAPVGESLEDRVARLVAESVVDGCVGEGAAARAAYEAARTSDDPAVTAVLARIATEESSHAALAADIVTWALRVHAAAALQGVERATRSLAASGAISCAHPGAPALPGRISGARHEALRRAESERVGCWLADLARNAA